MHLSRVTHYASQIHSTPTIHICPLHAPLLSSPSLEDARVQPRSRANQTVLISPYAGGILETWNSPRHLSCCIQLNLLISAMIRGRWSSETTTDNPCHWCSHGILTCSTKSNFLCRGQALAFPQIEEPVSIATTPHHFPPSLGVQELPCISSDSFSFS